MKVSRKFKHDILIYELDGSFDTNSAPDMEESINLDLYGGKSKMIFNLSKTSFISSAGLRVILSTNKRISLIGGYFGLCCPNEVVKNILEISGFSTFIKVGDSLEEVLKHF